MTRTELENAELRYALQRIHHELTNGQLVSRAFRAHQVTYDTMTKWEILDEQGNPVRPPRV